MTADRIAIVTGVAGFIGSHLAERLLQEYHVVGIDSFTDYYSRQIKERNLANLLSNQNFEFINRDLTDINYDTFNADYIFHQAAQPGVRASWGNNFDTYVKENIVNTQKILKACLNLDIKKLVFASSSSVYGDVSETSICEDMLPKPISPYGVTKLAAENLCYLYWKNYGVPIISLRYFTVYGPRQRPDMAINKFATSMLKNEEVFIYGDGSQKRDFTYVSDVAEANILAAKSSIVGKVFNIGSGSNVTILTLISLLEKIMRKKAKKQFIPRQKGDVVTTLARIEKAKNLLGYNPKVSLEQGLRLYIKWLRVQGAR